MQYCCMCAVLECKTLQLSKRSLPSLQIHSSIYPSTRPARQPSIYPSILPAIHPSNHSLMASSIVQVSNLWSWAAAALWLTGCRALITVHTCMDSHTCKHTHIHAHTQGPSNVVDQLPVSCRPLSSVTQTALHLLVLLLHSWTQGTFQSKKWDRGIKRWEEIKGREWERTK